MCFESDYVCGCSKKYFFFVPVFSGLNMNCVCVCVWASMAERGQTRWQKSSSLSHIASELPDIVTLNNRKWKSVKWVHWIFPGTHTVAVTWFWIINLAHSSFLLVFLLFYFFSHQHLSIVFTFLLHLCFSFMSSAISKLFVSFIIPAVSSSSSSFIPLNHFTTAVSSAVLDYLGYSKMAVAAFATCQFAPLFM